LMEINSSDAWSRRLISNTSEVYHDSNKKISGYSIRCVKNDTTYITGGTISQDSTWTKARSPYVISGDVVVDNGATLTIEPGVEVLFESFTDDNPNDHGYPQQEGRAGLVVRGILNAIGTISDTISIRNILKDTDTYGSWEGIIPDNIIRDWQGFDQAA